MIVFKSDGRYKNYNRGFHHIIEFRWNNRDDTAMWIKMREQFEELYGPASSSEIVNGYLVRELNKHYTLDQNKAAKRRRIYVKEEADVTLALLRIENGSN